MAIPTAEESRHQFTLLWQDALKPIWPNLTKRQTRLEFEAISSIKRDKLVFMSFDTTSGSDIPEDWSNPTGFIPYAKHS